MKDDTDQDEIDFENNAQEDILRPSSTRSIIVVNLVYGEIQGNKFIEKKKTKNIKKKNIHRDYDIQYNMDKYDMVRMKLALPESKLYRLFEQMKHDIQNNRRLQPRKMQIHRCRQLGLFIPQILVILGTFYLMVLIMQAVLFNLVLLGIMFVYFMKFIQWLEHWKEQHYFNIKKRDLETYMTQTNLEGKSEWKHFPIWEKTKNERDPDTFSITVKAD